MSATADLGAADPGTVDQGTVDQGTAGQDAVDQGTAGQDAADPGTASRAVEDALRTAEEQGRICALAAAGQRDLADRAAAYPELFPAGPFDATLYGSVALATAFGAPWCDRDQLRIANRAALWIFAVDWLIDHRARSRAEVDSIVRRCLLVADGAAPAAADPLARFLAEIRDEIRDGSAATAPAKAAAAVPAGAPAAVPAADAAGEAAWRAELRRMLHAMAREWDWKQRLAGTSVGAGSPPDLDEYLANADNFGSSFVNVSHWLRTGDAGTLAHLPELTAAGREVQRVLRLVNDLATYQRDLRWGDLNALLLGVDRAEVTRRVDRLVRRCRELFAALPHPCRAQGAYLARQIGFSTGFYHLTDFWGRS